MKRFLSVMVVLGFFSFAVIACSNDGTSEAKSLMQQQVTVIETYVEGLEKAQSADDMVQTVDRYSADMKKLIPRLKAFHDKYPDYDKDGIPKALEAELQRVEKASDRLPAAMMNSMQYMTDPKVQEAMQRMTEELSGMY